MYWLYAVQNGDVSVVRSTAIFGASAAEAPMVSALRAAAVSADRAKARFVCMCCFLPNFFDAVFVRGRSGDGQAIDDAAGRRGGGSAVDDVDEARGAGSRRTRL